MEEQFSSFFRLHHKRLIKEIEENQKRQQDVIPQETWDLNSRNKNINNSCILHTV